MLDKKSSKDALYLKNLRVEKLHLTQEEFAKKLNMSKQYIAAIETGARNIGNRLMTKLHDVFPGVSERKVVWHDKCTPTFLKDLRSALGLTQKDIADTIGRTRIFVNTFENSNKTLDASLYELIRSKYEVIEEDAETPDNLVRIIYRPDVYLSAGYGMEVYNEEPEYAYLDKKFFISDKGLSINPKYCEIVSIYGDSMLPEYRHGDKVIIDKSVTKFIDGQIFAFSYEGQTFIKEINLINKRIKCIPLNDKYDPFYIDENMPYQVIGLVIPRVRL